MTKNKKEKLHQVGTTETGQTVVNGSKVFKLMESVGIPLDIILDKFKKECIIVDWIGFYETGLNARWHIKTIFDRIEPAVTDIYGVEYCTEVIKRLKYYIMECNANAK